MLTAQPPILEWGSNKPNYKKKISGHTAFAQFLYEAKEIAYIDKPYGHKEHVYVYKGHLVRVSSSALYHNDRYVHYVEPEEHGIYFHWRQTKYARQMAPKFGAKIVQEPTKDFWRKKQLAEATGLRGMPKPMKTVVK